MNESPAETYIKDLDLGPINSDKRLYRRVYDNNKSFCKEYNYKVLPAKYFTKELEKQGYSTNKKRINHIVYIMGKYTNNEDNAFIIEDDEED